MASYKSDFDPPNRPDDSLRSRRMGTYMAPPTMERRREPSLDRPTKRAQPTTSKTQPRTTVLPQKPMQKQDVKEKGTTSGFGFGKPPSKPASTRAPELKGKSSRNVLRRKQSSISQPQQSNETRPTIERSTSATPGKQVYGSSQRRPSLEISRSADAYNEIYTRPTRTRTPAAKESPRIIPELDRYRPRPEQATFAKIRSNGEIPHKLATQDLPPPTPLLSGTPGYSGVSSTNSRYSGYSGSGYSASPSTRFSESPGPGGAYSRDTTPTSMSSQSPGIVAPLKLAPPRLRQGSPATSSRPPLTRRRDGSFPQEYEEAVVETLPSLRESVTSSSSNSTVKGDNKGSEKKKKKKRLSPLPPSPPPRKSSQKASPEGTPSKSSQSPAQPIMTDSPSSRPRGTPVSSPSKQNPPVRPSREGAPDLQSQLGESMTVIQSNLAGIPFPQERRQSTLQRHVTSPLQSQPVIRPSQGSRLPSRNPSPSPVLTSPREATPAPTGLGIVPDLRPREQPSTRGINTRTPSPSIQTSKPRFGLFGRRTKTTPEITTSESRNKEPRKGPAAGTGHEGYGRYALRGRSSSTGAGMVARDRSQSRTSSSRDSIGSNHAPDPFLLERMSPVVIAGGGEIKENRNASSELSRTESNTSLLLGRPSLDSRGSSKSSLGQEASRTTLWPSALPEEQPSKRNTRLAIPKGRRPSDSSDDGITKPSLAFRRSLLRLNVSENALNLPRPINIPTRGVSPAMSSLDASLMSDDSRMEPRQILSRGRKEGKKETKKPKKLEKRARSPRKWNFFHRSQPSNAKSKGGEPVVPVAVERPSTKPAAVPHYAMIDSSDEQQEIDAVDLEDILRDAANVMKDADVVNLSNEELDVLQFGNYKDNLRRIEDLHSILGVSPPPEKSEEIEKTEEIPPPPMYSSPEPMQVTPELPQTEMHPGKDVTPPALIRPSRLAQVGRIPKVISARPQATSPKSFSRPFARLSTIQPVSKPAALDKQSVAVGPSPTPSTSDMRPVANSNGSPSQAGSSRQNSGDSKPKAEETNDLDFIKFSPQRKNSESTTISSSGMSFAGTTAVVPEVGADLEEDEVWNEFDDLIENDNEGRPISTTSSCGVPFQYESYESRRMRKSRMKAKGSPTLASHPVIKEPPKVTSSRRSEYTTSSVYSVDVSSMLQNAAVDTNPTPTSAMSFGDFISGYGDRNNSVSVNGDQGQEPSRASQSSSRKSISSANTSNSIRRISDDNNSPISQVNLRIGSMTVSKWLTFGHVLFSPAREEIMQSEGSKRHSILVIDGLGNDDWSFYAAETYPTSTFYNLSPTRPVSSSQRASDGSSSLPLTPPNHRQVQYTSPMNKFPFPSSNFHVVVLRFPTAMSEASYRNIISESKRVLKPGGYLETAILDLDMLNMGNRSRRAVRGLKVQMQVANSSISLSSASDTVLRLIGKRGFVDVKTCNVGIPVASAIPSPSSSQVAGTKKEELSLADMMKDDSQVGDEGITKMVAKVGRWWWMRCYEVGVMPREDLVGERSVFTDAQLVEECEKWKSSFKLVVAYAQKPDVGRRRTASV